MPGIGALVGNFLRSGAGKELVSQAESAAVQQAGAQVGAAVVNSPHALREKIGRLESYTSSPGGFLSTPLDNWFPRFQHTIHVAVAGGPDTTVKDIWKLAVSAAFGRLRRRIATFAGVRTECIWDISDKTVAIRIVYGSNGLIPAILAITADSGLNEVLKIPGQSAVQLIQDGPSPETVGGNWPGFLQTTLSLFGRGTLNALSIGGRPTPKRTATRDDYTTSPNTERGGRLERESAITPPALIDDGRIITTANYLNPDIQPPRPTPYQDYVAIVSQALTAPCYLPCPPPRGFQNKVRSPVYLYNPGNPPADVEKVVDLAELKAEDAIRKGTSDGLDGTPPPTDAQNPKVPDECAVQNAELRADPNQIEPE